MTTNEAAKILGVKITRLSYVFQQGQVAKPPKDASGRYYYTQAVIKKLRRELEKLEVEKGKS
jgi:DNA-binding transcriptional MerR regulator